MGKIDCIYQTIWSDCQIGKIGLNPIQSGLALDRFYLEEGRVAGLDRTMGINKSGLRDECSDPSLYFWSVKARNLDEIKTGSLDLVWEILCL